MYVCVYIHIYIYIHNIKEPHEDVPILTYAEI